MVQGDINFLESLSKSIKAYLFVCLSLYVFVLNLPTGIFEIFIDVIHTED